MHVLKKCEPTRLETGRYQLAGLIEPFSSLIWVKSDDHFLSNKLKRTCHTTKNSRFFRTISILNQGGTSVLLYFFVLFGTSLYFLVLLRTSRYFSVLLDTSSYFSVLLRTSRYFSILLGTSPYFSVLLRTSPYFSVLLRTSRYLCRHLLALTSPTLKIVPGDSSSHD
jgi:hypothetical protein